MSDKIHTFWDLLTKHQVVIPIIQRDYAQGRTEKRVTQIRTNFVRSLLEALNQNKTISLGFVYGKIEGKEEEKILIKNKEAVSVMLKAVENYAHSLNLGVEYDFLDYEKKSHKPNTKLFPLDGQQRLTTLFLLHWYLIQRNNSDKFVQQITVLKGFDYQTRQTTKDFCEAITNGNVRLKGGNFKSEISTIIKNSTWFLRSWLYDPSIQGMLKMLDEINKQINEQQSETLELWEGLVVNKNIQFDFLDLDELEQTDELYVKMNARGKSLTDFEHFKAWLQNEIKNQEIEVSDWAYKMDADWYDLFWKNKPTKVYEIDKDIYNCIKVIGLYDFLINDNPKNAKYYFIERIINKGDFISLRDFKQYNFFSVGTLNFVFKTLNNLKNNDLSLFDNYLKDIYKKPFGNDESLTTKFLSSKNLATDYQQRIFYFAFILFLNNSNHLDKHEKKESFKSWMRVVRNLIFNTNIQRSDDIINAVEALYKLSENMFDIEEYLKSDDVDIKFFSRVQIREEKEKLKYFSISNFEETIKEQENQNYFYGQIGFLFRLLPEDEKSNIELFKNYAQKISKYFSNNDTSIKPFEFQRKLLMKGDYFIHKSGNKYRFNKRDAGSLRARNDNWRSVFNSSEDSKSFLALKNFVEADDFTINTVGINDWRKYFIEYPEIMGYCIETFVDYYNQLDIRLINKSTYNGRHADLYSYVLYLNLLKRNDDNFSFRYKDVNNFRTNISIPSLEVYKNEAKLLEVIYTPPYIENNIQAYFKIILECPNSSFFEESQEEGVVIVEVGKVSEIDKFIHEFNKELKKV